MVSLKIGDKIVMPTYGKKLLDATGNVILPKTRSNLVYHGSTLLSTKIDNIDTEISNIKNGTTTVAKATALTTNAGDSNTPIYFSGGKPVSTGKSFANYVPKSGGTLTGMITCNGGIACATDKSPGSTWNRVHPTLIPNISSNIRTIILWT